MATEGNTHDRAGAKEDCPDTLLRSGSIFGAGVRNRSGEELGHIRDILVDVESGRAAYIVLAFGGGVLGVGEKVFAIPWENLSSCPERGEFILDIGREHLEKAEGLSEDEWPLRSDWKHTRSLMPYREE